MSTATDFNLKIFPDLSHPEKSLIKNHKLEYLSIVLLIWPPIE